MKKEKKQAIENEPLKKPLSEEQKAELGVLVVSTAGRDKGKFFVITEIVDDDYVRLADGSYHKLQNAKKKKRKHLKKTRVRFDGIGEKLLDGRKVFDSEVYSAIKKTLEAIEEAKKQPSADS